MWLLNAHTFEVKKRGDITGSTEYATISHRCTDYDAGTSKYTLREFLRDPQNVARIQNPIHSNFRQEEVGFAKVAWGCYLARKQKIGYIWVDTCCIDKGPEGTPAEFNQDMNSMFRYYKEAKVCFAFLLDANIQSFQNSVWFERGWTLQELLASGELRFYDYRWRFMGSKQTLSARIQAAANIEAKYLEGDFRKACIAERMSWMSGRTTTQREDMAYSMLGILGVSMDIRYGEHENAFLRLEERIVDDLHDESIFAWSLPDSKSPPDSTSYGLLAPWPSCFRDCRSLTVASQKFYKPRVPYKAAKQGVEFNAPSRLPDHANGADWNNLRASRRTTYELGLNCWVGEPGPENHVTIHLEKNASQQWRRVQSAPKSTRFQKLRWDAGTLRSSYDIAGSKTRPIYVPHVVEGDEDMGRSLADQTDQNIREVREEKKRGQQSISSAPSTEVDNAKSSNSQIIEHDVTSTSWKTHRMSLPKLKGSLQFRSPVVWQSKSDNG